MRKCNNCTKCCDGWLSGFAFGSKFGPNKCVYLCSSQCCIYPIRPNTCRKYECAWVQGLFPENFKPNECGIIISIEYDTSKTQFLKVIEMQKSIDLNVYKYIDNWVNQYNTYYVVVPYNKNFIKLE